MTLHGLRIDPESQVPPFEQLRTQIIDLVAAGTLRVGDRLPPIRTLATDVGLAAGTVARVYRELEGAGIVITRGRAGTIVADGVDPTTAAARQAAYDFVVAARNLRLTDTQIIEIITSTLAAK